MQYEITKEKLNFIRKRMPSNNWEPAYNYKKNKFYKKYELQKEDIKKKYPRTIFTDDLGVNPTYGSSEERRLYNEYLKEIGDLLFKPNGYYQQFIWDTMPENEKLVMERRARGKMSNGEYS